MRTLTLINHHVPTCSALRLSIHPSPPQHVAYPLAFPAPGRLSHFRHCAPRSADSLQCKSGNEPLLVMRLKLHRAFRKRDPRTKRLRSTTPPATLLPSRGELIACLFFFFAEKKIVWRGCFFRCLHCGMLLVRCEMRGSHFVFVDPE